MTLFFHVGDVGDLGSRRVRLATGFQVTEYADSGTIAMSQVTVDDIAGDLTITGHQSFRIVETDCSWETLFRGWFADRTISRGDASRVGASRVWDCTVTDANAAMQYEEIRGSGGKRPKETDTQRLAWILGSSWRGPVSSSDANVLGYGVALDKADYRGQTMADVVNDCAQASGANYWAQWDFANHEYRLHYYRPTRAYNTSAIAISNVLSDVDGWSVFAAEPTAKLNRDPSRVYSGVYFEYGEKGSAVFRESATVLAAIGHKRETHETDGSVRTAARATARADRYLAEAEEEDDGLTLTIPNVPAARVNLIRAGQRIHCTFTHLPGFQAGAYIRIAKRTVQQTERQGLYRVDLELSNPKRAGSRVRHKPVPVPPEMEDGASVAMTRYLLEVLAHRIQAYGLNTYGPIPDAVNWGPSVSLERLVRQEAGCHNVPYTSGLCPIGLGAQTGEKIHEQWFAFDGDDAGAVGVRVTLSDMTGDAAGVAAGSGLVWGIGHDAPTGEEQFDVLGSMPVTGGTVVIPASLITPGETNYFVVGAAWRCMRGVNVCSNDLPGGGIVANGLFASGNVVIPAPSAVAVGVDGSGGTSWLSGQGETDGTNRTYTLVGWNGRGVPDARVGIAVLGYPADYDLDDDAGTVTLRSPAPAGSNVAFRYDL